MHFSIVFLNAFFISTTIHDGSTNVLYRRMFNNYILSPMLFLHPDSILNLGSDIASCFVCAISLHIKT